MQIVKPSAEIVFPSGQEVANEMLTNIEEAARTCYKTEGNIGQTYNAVFLQSLIDRGHLSVIEHSLVTVRFTCDRGISHEIVRHRIAGYSQESTRYCNYSQDRFGNQVAFIDISGGIKRDTKTSKLDAQTIHLILCEWTQALVDAEKHYFRMIELGASPQIARAVLPNSLKTEIVMSANLREWRHFFTLRTTPAAHPQMREITIELLKDFRDMFYPLFEDINNG